MQSVRLGATDGLARWLAAQARPAALSELRDADIVRELKLLQGVVATPLLAHGELVAILVLGQPVFGGGYARTEIETLFDLATQLATVIRDITLHQHLQREKEFNERILSHMSSGVVTIGRDHRVGTMNRRAEEILGLSAHAVVGQDLRVLPSPLGDLLFDTLSSGRPQPRTEIQMALRRLWVEVSTYAIRDEEGAPLGAVLVFEDALIPWENFLIYGNLEIASTYHLTGFIWRALMQGCTRLAVKLDFITGLLIKATEITGARSFRGVEANIGEVIAWRNMIWGLSDAMAKTAGTNVRKERKSIRRSELSRMPKRRSASAKRPSSASSAGACFRMPPM